MTDRDRLAQLLRDFGVVFAEEDATEWWPGQHATPPWPRPEKPGISPAHITIKAGDGPKNDGYTGFYCAFKFADDGSFLAVEVAE